MTTSEPGPVELEALDASRASLRERVVAILAEELALLRRYALIYETSKGLSSGVAPNPVAGQLAVSIVETLGELAKEECDDN